MPGVDVGALQQFLSGNQLFGLFNLFSGGSMQNFSIALMGVAPYITASIIIQLLTMVVPSFEELSKEGEWGQKTLNQYTRFLTVPLAIFQAYGMLAILRSQGVVERIVLGDLVLLLVSATAGTLVLMWIGELISEMGVGNGISLIITLGIVGAIPQSVQNTYLVLFGGGIVDWGKVGLVATVGAAALLVLGLIVLMTEAERRIPVVYARRVRGPKSFGAVETHLPLRVVAAGVIPIIFALSVLLVPGVITQFFTRARSEWLANAAAAVNRFLQPDVVGYSALYFFLVVAFTYFYTSIVFRPDQMAENLQKRGGFIPGIRPGSETILQLNGIITRINLTGGLFLGLVAILPSIVQGITHINTIILGGTGLLIVVAVIIETMRQIQAQLLTHTYEQY